MNIQIAEILQLSVPEKVQIVEDIWDSIYSQPEELILSENEKRELDARLTNYQANLDEEISWENLKKTLS